MPDDLLLTLETRRRHDRNFFFGSILFSLCLLLWLSIFLPLQWVGFSAMVAVLINAHVYYLLHRHFKRKGKMLFLTTLAQEFGLTYSPSHVFEVAAMMDHGIVPHYSFKETEDGFKKNSAAFPIAFQEVTLKKVEEDPQQNKRYTLPVFHGLMIRVSLKRRLDFHTIILPNRFLRPNVEAGSIPYDQGFEEIKLIAPQFTKLYKAYSTHQVESRAIFDPLFMERFIQLGEHLNAQWLEASFYKNELLIMARFKKDHFEIGSIMTPVLEDDLDKVRDEIRHILQLSDILKHNTYIGS